MEYDADVLHSVGVGSQLVTVDKHVGTSKLSSPPAGDPLEPHVTRARDQRSVDAACGFPSAASGRSRVVQGFGNCCFSVEKW